MQSLVTPLDRLRGALLRSVAPLPVVGGWLRRREPRIVLRACAAIMIGTFLALVAPAFALAIGPILFGVPHVASSIRYLVLRQRFSRLRLGLLAVYALSDASLRVAEQVRGTPHLYATLENGLGVVLGIGTLVAAIKDGASSRRAALVLLGVLSLGLVGLAHPVATRLGFVHVHNLGVVVLWIIYFRARGGGRLAIVPSALLFLAIAAVTAFGLFSVPPLTRAGGVDLTAVSIWLAPGATAGVALALVLAHAFTDSVHYAFWLGVVPEETLRNQGTPTFRMTLALLRRDFGEIGFALLAVATIGLPVLALVDVVFARRAYFALAGFHGHLEGAAIVYVVACGGRVRPNCGPRSFNA